MDRNAILGGSLSPTIICFKTPNTSTDYALLPATIDGATYPPSADQRHCGHGYLFQRFAMPA